MATIPNTNVNLATNVRDVLNAAGGSVNNDLTSFFKAAAKINKYSRYKPYVHSKDFDLTDSDIKGINFGMTPKEFGLGQLNGNAAYNPSFVWGQWSLPTTKLRLGDFRGYDSSNKLPHIAKIEFFNDKAASNNPDKILPVMVQDGQLGLISCTYTARITLNPSALIKIGEFHTNGYDIGKLYYTLLIGSNVGGFQEVACFGQDGVSVSERTGSDVYITCDTAIAGAKDILDTNSGYNIVILCLMPKCTAGTAINRTAISPQMWDNSIAFLLYNSKYAMYGDGSGGGNIPVSTIYAHIDTKTADGTPLVSVSQNSETIMLTVLNYPTITCTTGGSSGAYVALGLMCELRYGGALIYQGAKQFTEEEILSTTGQVITWVNPMEGLDLFGVILGTGGNKGVFSVRYKYILYQKPVGTTFPAQVASDGIGVGLQSNWKETSITVI